MFWGLNLKPNRKYSQTATKSFHISSAALDGTTSKGGPTQIYISSENEKFLVCTLQKEGPLQVMLDLNFCLGENICFQSIGSGNVSLTGYISETFNDFEDGEEEEEEEGSMTEEEMADLRNALMQKRQKGGKNAEPAVGEDEVDSEDSEDDPDFNGVDDSMMEEESGEEEGEDEDDDDEDGIEEDSDAEEEESDEEEMPAKKPKVDSTEKLQNGKVSSKNQKEQNNKKNQQEKQQPQQSNKKEKQQQNKKPDSAGSKVGVERTITGGVKIIDIREGTGPEAKNGKKAQVYYEGRLKSNNKMFDSLKNGAGFKFSLGRGEVIKAWDVGVAGMKVGGKRRIICPPHMAYGSQGSPPTIPPNSTLVFEVELKAVN